CYASVLFGTGADRSFVSTAFSSQFDIAPTVLDHDYAVKLADGRIVGVNTEVEGKSEKKRLENVPIVRDFLKIFLENLSGLPPTRQVVFQIDLIPDAAPVARAPYRLAPPEMKELSEQLKELFDKGFIRPSSSLWGALNKKDHEEHLRTILKLLTKEELYAKFSKCEFWIPKDEKEHEEHLRQILKLLKKEELYTKFSKYEFWIPKGDKQEATFQLLKQKLCSVPILALPEGSKDFIVYCDASNKGLGAVLMQREEVMSYASRQLKVHEKNYTTHDLKLGAVVFTLKT
nr:hypothetical protein [Tanacetum cinerariifolium]